MIERCRASCSAAAAAGCRSSCSPTSTGRPRSTGAWRGDLARPRLPGADSRTSCTAPAPSLQATRDEALARGRRLDQARVPGRPVRRRRLADGRAARRVVPCRGWASWASAWAGRWRLTWRRAAPDLAVVTYYAFPGRFRRDAIRCRHRSTWRTAIQGPVLSFWGEQDYIDLGRRPPVLRPPGRRGVGLRRSRSIPGVGHSFLGGLADGERPPCSPGTAPARSSPATATGSRPARDDLTFHYQCASQRVVFAAGSVQRADEELAALGVRRALLIANPARLAEQAVVASLTARLGASWTEIRAARSHRGRALPRSG